MKPITYQHQSGGIYHAEMMKFHQSILRDLTPQEATPIMYKLLGLDERPWDEIIQTGFDPQHLRLWAVPGHREGRAGQGRCLHGDWRRRPTIRADQAVCTPDIVRRSVLATYRAGGQGVVFSPNYAGMNLTTLDGAGQALSELGLK